MCTIPGVLMGQNLASFISSNYALLEPTLVTIGGGSIFLAGDNFTISTFAMARTPVTNEQYADYSRSLGGRRYALVGRDLNTDRLGVVALGRSKGQLLSTLKSVAGELNGILIIKGLQVLLNDPQIVHITSNNPPARFDGPGQPVVNVTWFEAAIYAYLHGGMLPTAWQWEYAGRVDYATEETRNYATRSGNLNRKEAHYRARSTVDVYDPRYPELRNGLRHMAGNVDEWMQNWHAPYLLESTIEPTDPTGAADGIFKSLRGGSWKDKGDVMHYKYTRGKSPLLSANTIGFRVAAPVQSASR